MKKISLALIAVLAFAFIGCNSWLDFPEPEPEPDPEPEPNVEAVITLEETSATLTHGETYQINAECENPITYTSENEYHATVSEEGLVTANYVGSTVISLETEFDTKSFEVTVEPVSNLYPEPNIEFGESKESVIEKLGQPGAETEDAIGYPGYSENVMMLMVMFNEEDLVESYVVLLTTNFEEELGTFVSERYMFIQEMEGMKMYVNALDLEEASVVVGVQLFEVEGENLLMVIYGNIEEEPVEMSVSMKALFKALVK